jgi:hypothetical protein
MKSFSGAAPRTLPGLISRETKKHFSGTGAPPLKVHIPERSAFPLVVYGGYKNFGTDFRC